MTPPDVRARGRHFASHPGFPQDGASRFYAEVLRLKQLMDTAGQGAPFLFLVDEILHQFARPADRSRGDRQGFLVRTRSACSTRLA